MAIPDIPGAEWVNNIDVQGFGNAAINFIVFILLLIIITVIIGIYLYKKRDKKMYKNKINWFEDIQGENQFLEADVAAEVIIPNTNVRVFYIKAKKMYIPRPTRKMGPNSYWYSIRDNREIINFTIKSINKDMKEADLDYDHEDMRLAHLNIGKLIARNYKDKAKKWWVEYQGTITLVIYIFVLTLSFIFIISKIGNLLGAINETLSRLADVAASIAEMEAARAASSGVVAA